MARFTDCHVKNFLSTFSHLLNEHIPPDDFLVKQIHRFSHLKYGGVFFLKNFSRQIWWKSILEKFLEMLGNLRKGREFANAISSNLNTVNTKSRPTYERMEGFALGVNSY